VVLAAVPHNSAQRDHRRQHNELELRLSDARSNNVKTKILAVIALATTAALAIPDAPAATHFSSDEGTVLALGDSVAFGYITRAGFQYVNPDNFIGYPQYVGLLRHKDTVDAACPGETTGTCGS
jgi:hypothetical protein